MLRAYIGETIPGVPVIELLRPNIGKQDERRWAERSVRLREPVVELVASPEVADALIVPHNFGQLVGYSDFLHGFESLSERWNKKIIVFFPGDSDAEVPVKNSVVFRNSRYISGLRGNEIILPGYAEDLGDGIAIKPRIKAEKAMVSFCGWAEPDTLADRVKLYINGVISDLRYALGYKSARLRQKGLWWRKKAIGILARSRLVDTDFIIRHNYSGSEKTIKMDFAKAKSEYVGNILSGDFTLCVKGDGNFSTRFYEVLSLGRVPLLLDTECVLPLEDVIDYSKCILKIDHTHLSDIDRITANFYAGLSQDKIIEMEKTARLVFEKYLRLDSFFKYVFLSGYLEKYLRKGVRSV